MRVKVNLKMLLELLLHPPSPLFYFIFLKSIRFVKCHLAGIAGWEQGGCGGWRGAKCFFSFLEQFGDWAASTEVSYWGFLLILFPEATSFSQAMQAGRHTPCIHLTSPLALPWQFQEEITAGQSSTAAGKQMSNETDGIILYAPRWQSVSIYAHMHVHIGMYRLSGVKSMTWSRSRSLPGAVHATRTSPWDRRGDESHACWEHDFGLCLRCCGG